MRSSSKLGNSKSTTAYFLLRNGKEVVVPSKLAHPNQKEKWDEVLDAMDKKKQEAKEKKIEQDKITEKNKVSSFMTNYSHLIEDDFDESDGTASSSVASSSTTPLVTTSRSMSQQRSVDSPQVPPRPDPRTVSSSSGTSPKVAPRPALPKVNSSSSAGSSGTSSPQVAQPRTAASPGSASTASLSVDLLEDDEESSSEVSTLDQLRQHFNNDQNDDDGENDDVSSVSSEHVDESMFDDAMFQDDDQAFDIDFYKSQSYAKEEDVARLKTLLDQQTYKLHQLEMQVIPVVKFMASNFTQFSSMIAKQKDTPKTEMQPNQYKKWSHEQYKSMHPVTNEVEYRIYGNPVISKGKLTNTRGCDKKPTIAFTAHNFMRRKNFPVPFHPTMVNPFWISLVDWFIEYNWPMLFDLFNSKTKQDLLSEKEFIKMLNKIVRMKNENDKRKKDQEVVQPSVETKKHKGAY